MSDERRRARDEVAAWIALERSQYALVIYGEDTESRHKLILELQNFGFTGDDNAWMAKITGYLKRAELQGLDTLAGRQALGKAITTCMHALETAVQYNGPMPKPGISSSEGAQEWR